MNTDRLYFGAAYYFEYLPYDRIETDMEMMERAGMNTIRIAESTWSTLEPSDGVFDFTHIDRMLSAAAKHHISVIVGTPTYAIPAWLVKKYPDILAVTANGQELYGHRQNMDITHAAYRRYAGRVIQKLMEHIQDVPHIIGFQLDNETKSYGTAGPFVQAMFVDKLKKQFPDIEAFNHEFGLDYWSNRIDDWNDFPDIRGTINQSLAAEFQKFQRSLVTEFLNWQADIVQKYKREDQFITQNFDYDWTAYSYGYQPEVNQYDAAKCLTVAGADIYHPSQGDLTGAEITVCGNIARSLKKENYLILETQAQGNTEWLPYPGQLRLQAYSHIANGANSVLYWHWHSIHNAIESYWKGILSHNFSENETYREVSKIGAEWKRIGSRLINLKKENSTAVLLDNNSLTGLCHFPLETTGSHSYNTVLRWLCDSLYRLNIEYDMISSAERDFSRYQCLVVPALYSAPEDLLCALSDYVKAGGHLITTFRSGFADEHLKIYPDTQPHILHECLGLHYDQFTYPKNVKVTLAEDIRRFSGDTMKTKDPKSPHTSNAKGISGNVHDWMELVVCDTAHPIAGYEHPVYQRFAAAAENNYGNGSSLYLSAFFDENILEEILSHYYKEHQISGHASTHTFPIIQKHGRNDFDKELRYYFNYSDKSQQVAHTASREGTELLTGRRISCTETLSLAPWDLAIIEFE